VQIKALAVAAMVFGFLLAVVAGAQQNPTTPAGDSGVDIAASLKQLKNREKLVLKYDKFKDYTVVACKPFDLLTTGEHMAVGLAQGMGRGPYGRGPAVTFPSRFELSAAFGFKGAKLNDEPKFGLIFISGGADWRFLKDHKLYALVDGERLELGEGQHDGNVYLGGVSEEMIFDLTREQFEKLANGKSVEIQLGGFERKLKSGNLERLKILLSLAPVILTFRVAWRGNARSSTAHASVDWRMLMTRASVMSVIDFLEDESKE